MKVSQIKSVARRSLHHRFLAVIMMLAVVLAVYSLLAVCEELVNYGMEIKPDSFSWNSISNIAGIRDVDFYIVTAAAAIASLILVSPLLTGIRRFLWFALTDRDSGVGDIFYVYSSGKRLGKFLRLKVSVWLLKLMWTIIFLFPGAACMFCAERFAVSPIVRRLIYAAAALLFALGIVAITAFTLRYFMCEYLFICDDSLPAGKNILRSARMMRGCRASVFVLRLSFIGWFILCAAIFPAAYVAPYYLASMASAARFIMINSEKRQVSQA